MRNRDFRLLWAGQSLSAIGDQLFLVAIAVWVVEAGGRAPQLSFVFASRAVAMALFLYPAGLLADRIRRTRAMIAADATRALAILTLALTPTRSPIEVLAIFVFITALGEAFFRPAYTALLPRLLRDRELQRGNALMSASFRTSVILGPALGGLAIGIGGVRSALAINAGTFLISLGTLFAITERRSASRGWSPLKDALSGLQAVRQRPWILAIIALSSLHVMVAGAPAIVLLPIVAHSALGGTQAYSLILVAFGIGGLLGALLASRWTPRRPGLAALTGLFLFTGILVALAFPLSRIWVAGWHLAGAVGLELFAILWTSGLQREVPQEQLGRVTSLDYLGTLTLMPAGYALTGPAVSLFGQTRVLLASAVIVTVTTGMALAVPGVTKLRYPDERLHS